MEVLLLIFVTVSNKIINNNIYFITNQNIVTHLFGNTETVFVSLIYQKRNTMASNFELMVNHDKASKKFSEVYAHCQRLSATDLISFIQKVQTSVKPELKAIYIAAISAFKQNQAREGKGVIN